MKIQYVADDGTAFETEIECKEYEKSVSFGSDVRFVDVIADILSPVTHTSDRGYAVIDFEEGDDQIDVAIALAKNFEKLSEAYYRVSSEPLELKKVSIKPKLVTKKAKAK